CADQISEKLRAAGADEQLVSEISDLFHDSPMLKNVKNAIDMVGAKFNSATAARRKKYVEDHFPNMIALFDKIPPDGNLLFDETKSAKLVEDLRASSQLQGLRTEEKKHSQGQPCRSARPRTRCF